MQWCIKSENTRFILKTAIIYVIAYTENMVGGLSFDTNTAKNLQSAQAMLAQAK